ncbi:MAG: cupin domain-containing protein [Chloroflexi bacterium]|nr:cupin domain-containing protein [Chloroflexota bacterium]
MPTLGRTRKSQTPEVAPDGTGGDDVNVGQRLRQLRSERGLSIRTLAGASNLSVNTLSLIENGKTSPSVSTLQRLAAALGVPITAFFETDIPKSPIVHIKAHQRPRGQFAHGTLEDLGAGLSDRAVQPFLVTLEPNSGSGPENIVHTGYEFVFCLKGRITYIVEDRVYLLEPGDSLLFESRLPHRWHNVEPEPSQALLVLYPTDTHDRPTDRHFAHSSK